MKKWMKNFIIISAVVIVLAAAALLGSEYIMHTYIKNVGINLTPSRDYAVAEYTPYLQNDQRWWTDTVGTSSRSMAGVGCVLSCAASAITQLGFPVTPAELNVKMTACGGFQDGSDLIWNKLGDAVPGITYSYSRVFSAKTIEADLQNGLMPIVKVKANITGAQHWVMIVGARDGEFLVHDPLNRTLEPKPLSTHGRGYAYRVIKRA